MNNKGPRTDPWGTPRFRGKLGDRKYLTEMENCQRDRKKTKKEQNQKYLNQRDKKQVIHGRWYRRQTKNQNQQRAVGHSLPLQVHFYYYGVSKTRLKGIEEIIFN